MASYRRSTILINKPFQLRFAIYICTWLAAICFVYPVITQNLFDYLIRYASQDPMGPELTGLMKTKHDVLTLLMLTEVAFIAMTFTVCVFMSHRIAGPLFKLRRSLIAIGDGTWKGQLTFRRKDWFPELADDFNRMVQGIRERKQREDEMVAIAISRIEAAMNQAAPAARQELDGAIAVMRKLQEHRGAGETTSPTGAKTT